jgi:hypothetical protein
VEDVASYADPHLFKLEIPEASRLPERRPPPA